jgi:hypothetical protein
MDKSEKRLKHQMRKNNQTHKSETKQCETKSETSHKHTKTIQKQHMKHKQYEQQSATHFDTQHMRKQQPNTL